MVIIRPIKKGHWLKFCFYLLMSFSAPLAARADLNTMLEIAGYSSFIHADNFNFPLAAWGITKLNFKSVGNPDLLGEFQLDTLVSETVNFYVPRAYLKFNVGTFQVTVGKTRLSWGEGFLFNAGDVLFKSMYLPTLVDLETNEIHVVTDWLVAGYLPFGDTSFLEAVVLPHPQLFTPAENTLPVALGALDMGGRATFNLGTNKLEAGYLYKGAESINLPYLTLKANLAEWDWYLASSLAIPYNTPGWDRIQSNWQISTGFFRAAEIPTGGTISSRLEAVIKPFGSWQELSPSPQTLDYGLYLFSDLTIAQGDTLGYSLRTLYSPLDGSFLQIWNLRWSAFKDFTLNFFFSLMTGDNDDLFGWGRPGDITLTISSVYKFSNLD